jgi:hypothetical protein
LLADQNHGVFSFSVFTTFACILLVEFELLT